MTNQECIDYFIKFLKENKVKDYNIKAENDLVLFTVNDTTYSIFIEDFETVHYGVHSIEDVDLDRDYWSSKDEFESFEHIECFFDDVVKRKQYSYIIQIWKTLQKLEDDYDDDASTIAGLFFGLN